MENNQTITESESFIEALPENPVTSIIKDMNYEMSRILSENIAETEFTYFLIHNPLLVLMVFFIVTISISLFLNFIQDAWKVPIAIVIDMLAYLSLPEITIMSVIAGIGGFVYFFILFGDMPKMRYIFGGISFLKAILPLGMLALTPVTTILAIIAAFMTR